MQMNDTLNTNTQHVVPVPRKGVRDARQDAVDEDQSYPGLETMKEVHVQMWTRAQPPKGPSY